MRQGDVISADGSDISQKCGRGEFTYQWQRDGVDVPGADRPDYLLGADDVGCRIRVVTTFVDANGVIETFVSGATDPIEPAAAAVPEAAPGPPPNPAAGKRAGRKRFRPKTFSLTPAQIAALEARAHAAYVAGEINRPDVSQVVRRLFDDALGIRPSA